MYEPIEKKGLRIESTVNFGTIVQTLVMVGTVLFFVLSKANIADQSAKDLLAFRLDVAQQFLEVKAQISGLPDQRAAAVQTERRIIETIAKNGEQDSRLTKLEQDMYQIRADVAGVLRSSNAAQKH